ncbi:MAG: hypothetical protein U0798_06385 [Gemmataceae bacterium]
MYPSGSWEGFWQQDGWGRQPMKSFQLHFQNGTIKGGGIDVIGAFSIFGEYDPSRGSLEFAKKYHQRHSVLYSGVPDGEGGIVGTWLIQSDFGSTSGPFGLKPVFKKGEFDDTIREIGPTKGDQ